MRKILALCMIWLTLLPMSGFAATRTWSSSGSTDMNDGANYSGSGALLSTDDLVFDATSVINATSTAAISVNSVTTTSAYSGAWNMQHKLTSVGSILIDGTGVPTIADTVNITGNTGTLHVGSGVGTPAMTTAILYMGTQNAGVTDIDVALNAKALVIGVSDTVTSSGSANLIFSSASTPLILGDSSSYTQSNGVSGTTFIRSTAGDMYTVGTGVEIKGTRAFNFRSGANGPDVITYPAFNYTGTANVNIYENTGRSPISTLTGALATTGSLTIYRGAASGSHTFNQNRQTIAAANFLYGSNNATGVFTGNFSGNIVVSGNVNATQYNSGTITINDTAAWSVGGGYTALSAATYNMASGQSLTMTGAGVLTSAGVYDPKKVVFNPGAGKRDSLADNYDIDTLIQSSGILKFGARSGTVEYVRLAGDSTMNRMALCTLTVTGDSAIFSSTTMKTDSLALKWAGVVNLKNGTTQTIKRLIHSAAGALTRFCGTGAITVSNGPTQGDVQSVAAGTVNFSNAIKTDSLVWSAGTVTFAGDGNDTIGYASITGTANFSGDTTVFTGNVTTAEASTITLDAASKWICTKDGAVLAINGKSIPLVQLIGSANFTSSAATGGTIAYIDQTSSATDTTTFTAGKLWTCTSCDTAGLNGATGQYQVYRSATAGVQDTLALTADLVLSRTKWKDTHSKNRFYISNGTNENLGNLK